MFKEPTRILLIGNDLSLICARRLLLEHAGFSVIEVQTEQDALLQLQSSVAVRGVVICSTIDHVERQRLTKDLRQVEPGLAVMWLSCRDNDPTEVVDWANLQVH
jgi:hypothetical protein